MEDRTLLEFKIFVHFQNLVLHCHSTNVFATLTALFVASTFQSMCLVVFTCELFMVLISVTNGWLAKIV